MKLHQAGPGPALLVTAYGDGYVAVNGQRFETSVVVLPERVEPWPVASFDALAPADFELVRALAPEIVLLGTGPRQRFPHPRLTASLAQARIGLEVMDVQAACRTYNILVAEARKVAAALLLR